MMSRLHDMAHPAKETTLTHDDKSIIGSALAMYMRDCMLEAKSSLDSRDSIYPSSVRRATSQLWSDRGHRASDLYNTIMGSTTVTVRR